MKLDYLLEFSCHSSVGFGILPGVSAQDGAGNEIRNLDQRFALGTSDGDFVEVTGNVAGGQETAK